MAAIKRHLGLRIRFTLLASLLLLIAYLVIAFLLVRNAQNTDIRNINQDTRAFAALATPQIGNVYDIYQSSGSLLVNQQIQKFTALDSTIANVAIIDLNGQPAFQFNPKQPIAATKASNTFDTQYVKSTSGLITEVIVPYLDTNGEHPYSIAYAINPSVLMTDNQRQVKDIIIYSLIGLLVTAAAMYELMTRFFVRPIERMSQQALIISQGNYDKTVDVARNDEIGDLAHSVNTMSEHLKADIVALQDVDKLKNEFIMITSHNLRTPLTIIKGNIEQLQLGELPSEINEPLRYIEDSANELADFAEAMLTISTLEAGHTNVRGEPVTLEALTANPRERFDKAATDKGVTLNWQINEPSASVAVSKAFTQGILRNLLDNALKFTKEGGNITCSLSLANQQLKLVVEDSGIGISPEEQAKLFTKFHRGTSTMQYDYKGTGIGLYAAKLMAEAQHGTIQVKSDLGKGTTFTVTIPANSPAAS